MHHQQFTIWLNMTISLFHDFTYSLFSLLGSLNFEFLVAAEGTWVVPAA